MQQNDQNKMMSGAANKGKEALKEYFIPEAGRTVYAHSLEEAIAIVNKASDN